MTKAIMIQGTGSGVGKSIVVAALCRLLKKEGLRVAPFKAQNMALNSFVTADGKEMGRAQVFQAEAAGLLPDVRMNPILLKPSADSKSQVILMGEPSRHLSARDYYKRAGEHWQVVKGAFESLKRDFDVIVLEGAGSPAEINLRKTDLVNMKMAEYARAPVIIVADIDKGGVFASLKGTFDLVEDKYKELIRGFLINKFRGDVSLLTPGIEMFERLVPRPVLGVLPWFNDIHMDEEDGVFVKKLEKSPSHPGDILRVLIAKVPRISNFTDFSPLALEEKVEIRISDDPSFLDESHLLILPGTKATTSDLAFLHERGWREKIQAFLKRGGFIVGICGGYQMLGERIIDETGSDGSPGEYQGLSLLPIVTRMEDKKVLKQIEFPLKIGEIKEASFNVKGYEIHMGKTELTRDLTEDMEFISEDHGVELGLFNKKLNVFGTYCHGIFENDEFRRFFLNLVRKNFGLSEISSTLNYRAFREGQFDLLADWLRDNCDIVHLLSLIDSSPET